MYGFLAFFSPFFFLSFLFFLGDVGGSSGEVYWLNQDVNAHHFVVECSVLNTIKSNVDWSLAMCVKCNVLNIKCYCKWCKVITCHGYGMWCVKYNLWLLKVMWIDHFTMHCTWLTREAVGSLTISLSRLRRRPITLPSWPTWAMPWWWSLAMYETSCAAMAWSRTRVSLSPKWRWV